MVRAMRSGRFVVGVVAFALACAGAIAACGGGSSSTREVAEPTADADPFGDPKGFTPTSFAVEVHGEGRAVILIPGLGCPGAVWDETVAHLGRGYQTHVLTLSGFAGRPRIDAPLAATVRRELTRYIRSKHLKRPIIIGHSMGGLIAYWIATYHPDLVGGLIVVDAGPALADTDADTAKQLRDSWVQASDEEFARQARVMFTGMTNDPKRLEPIIAAAVRSDRRAMGDAVYELVTTDLADRVEAIHAPTLIVLADGIFKQMITAQVEPIPHHEVVVLPKTRHFVMLDDPAGFFRAVDAFLEKVN
jgi:pimeloyl-ACP methyl ester carboxylesterase